MNYKALITVTLRPSVLDPAGTAVRDALIQMDYAASSVRIGKYIELELAASSDTEAKEHISKICDRLLANPVIETYRFDVIPLEHP
ncbi:MAG: phosphoribosylformylglycinamidine synthase subunit PurS [Oscillatoriales cyanobacterium SM2_2_1]|nr:phosphoribosylformylglycinamidine synthase subunit PurS [Oscillatoriales cyanobacterium SM2_2_1]